ncbi:MAG: MlaE family ABC transporter permease [Acidimicrobiales bacterium]
MALTTATGETRTRLSARFGAAPAPVRSAVQAVDKVGDGVAGAGMFLLFSWRVLYHLVTDVILKLRFRRTVIMHMNDIALGSGAFVIGGGMIFVVAAMALAVGGAVGVQAAAGLSQVGAESYVGLVGAFAHTREVGPLITGLCLIAVVGADFTAQIGAMRISDEIDALETMSIPSIVYLVCTRLAAIVLALVPLYMVSMFVLFFATRLVNVEQFDMSPGQYDYYFHLYLPPIDVLYSVIKVVVFCVEICLIHSYYGYFASGGPVGVGQAVGIAIRNSIIAVVTTNLLLSYLFWAGTPTVSLTG